MAHTAKVLLTVDIEFHGKIIFENKKIYFYADVELCNIDQYGVDSWFSEDEIFRGEKPGYLYALKINDWCCSEPEVEDFEPLISCEEFMFLVKSEEFEDVEIDYEMFEPDWDLMREGK